MPDTPTITEALEEMQHALEAQRGDLTDPLLARFRGLLESGGTVVAALSHAEVDRIYGALGLAAVHAADQRVAAARHALRDAQDRAAGRGGA